MADNERTTVGYSTAETDIGHVWAVAKIVTTADGQTTTAEVLASGIMLQCTLKK